MSRADWYLRANLRFKHLQLLIYLDEMRSVSRVASALALTQPAISKMLSSMETGLGIKIFKRTSSGLEPTQHGLCMIQNAKDILYKLEATRLQLREITEGPMIQISMGVMPIAALTFAPTLLTALDKSSIDFSVNVRESNLGTLLPQLKTEQLKYIAGVIPNKPLPADICSEVFYEDSFVIAVRKEHPLANKPDLEWKDLSNFPMILPTRDAITREIIVDTLLSYNIPIPKQTVESLSTLTNVGMLKESDCFGTIPLEMANFFKKIGVLEILPLTITDIVRKVGLIWHINHEKTPEHEIVIKIFREAYAEYKKDPDNISITEIPLYG
ncbi:LysR family transcriptional regulator [Advenella sp. WQ 585]|uniref:LysR family transcriptional regulator n=1 Tax=Advenella mandrilli TaxID=2800330 RepID=A0ABS1EH27_9BURK|nr:LysR substrate-binding domain-containing protein [Advenella mandrilli]MBK1782329.1 LysR family transcriptional regulator [Advenella mandrilli]